ncbi:MAG TPA: hypothetical protein VN704_09945 [Verrucomicrobiae bacterium]|nr:hypothetical protein [Verrucomicrobiae bacterium]
MEKCINKKSIAAIFLAHLNPLTLSHEKIIQNLLKNYKVYVFPVRFLKDKEEINTRSFPFSFEIRKHMILESFNYDQNVYIMDNYTFLSPYINYLPPFISLSSQRLKNNIISSIGNSNFITYTGDRIERLLLKLFGFKPIQAKRQSISSTNVKKLLYQSALSDKNLSDKYNMNWNNFVSSKVSNVIRNNWNVVEHFSKIPDHTTHIFGMKFPKNGFIN